MIFFVSNIDFHGVTTFVIRFCKRLAKKGERAAVVVIYGKGDERLTAQMAEVADIYYLKDFFKVGKALDLAHFNVFRSIDITKFEADIVRKYGRNIHVTGVLGFALALSIKNVIRSLKISIGIYHQREFLYQYSKIDVFSRYILQRFRELKAAQLIFFNEYTRKEYSDRFNSSWNQGPIVPIGIDFPKNDSLNKRGYQSGKIVSVGQLLPFKTYNEAVLRLMPLLLNNVPNLNYYIYGDGPERSNLERLAVNLGLNDRVFFGGTIKYEMFAEVVRDANVFVGSGTAILEASALGVPSIVGIEGNKNLDTYGFISDIQGFTYNEMVPGIPRVGFLDCLTQALCGDDAAVENLGSLCKEKAQTFSITKTVDGFIESFDEIDEKIVIHYSRVWAFFSFLWIVALDKLGIDRAYRQRRNQ